MRAPRTSREEREARQLLEAGSRLLLARKLDLAIQKLQRVVDLLPNDLTARVNLGTAYYMNQRPQRAADQFREACKLAPDNATVMLNLAAALDAMGETAGAIQALEQTLEINPSHPDVHYNLAVAYIKTGERQKAIEELGRELEVNPRSRNALQLLHQLSGDPKAAPVAEQAPLSDHGRRSRRRRAGWRVWLLWAALIAGAALAAHLLQRI